MSYLHGAEVIELEGGPRPIQTVSTSVIGIIGTAPDADAAAFPLNKPVLVAGSRKEAAKLDTKGNGAGTLPQALDGIFDQAGAVVVVIRVDVGADTAATQANVIGGVNASTGQYTGIQALLAAKGEVKVQPRILCAPGFDHVLAVGTELASIADKLRAFVYLSGPNTNDAAAISYREKFGSKRVMVCDPWVRVFDTVSKGEIVQPPSARLAGLCAKIDNEKGFWNSISNNEIRGIIGTARPIDFTFGDKTCRANLLNEKHVTTIILDDGFRVWGGRTCSSDTKWIFEPVVRTADIINDSILRAHKWAVDRGITKTYLEDVTAGVDSYMRNLVSIGAIIGGSAWADPELNSPTNIQLGHVYFDFDFTPVYPAERVTFRSRLVNNYLEEITK